MKEKRNKSLFVWFEDKESSRIKLEIGSSVRPDPFMKCRLKTYIQEYLENNEMHDTIREFELSEVVLNTLKIERTFIDKLFSVKRHAKCGTLNKKVRHIYDVVKLYKLTEIQEFLSNQAELKKIVGLTKETDSYYLKKRNLSEDYNPKEAYDYESWRELFDDSIKKRYENLHEDLLYTDEKQSFTEAINTFNKINNLLKDIEE